MKLIMESWNEYLVEDQGSLDQRKKEFFDLLDAILSQIPSPPQQEGLDERMPRWAQRIGATAALGGAMLGGVPAAYADAPVSDPAPTHQVAPQKAISNYDAMLGMLNDFIETKPLREKGDLMLKLGHLLSALDIASDTGDSTALDALEGGLADARQQLSDSIQKVKDGAAAGDQDDIDLYSFWGRTGQSVEIN